MPSSCPNGMCSTAKNGLKNQSSRSTVNHRFKSGPREPPTQPNIKGSRGTKPTRVRPPNDTSNPLRLMDTSPSVRSHVSNPTINEHSASHVDLDGSQSEGVRGDSVEQLHGASNHTARSADPQVTRDSVGSGTSFQAPIYDPSLAHAFITPLQGYVPAGSCAIPNCSVCCSSASRALQYTSNIIPGSVYPDVTSIAPTSAANRAGPSAYVLLGQDLETQKQMYQMQLAMSNLNMNTSHGTPLAAECAVGIPVFRPSVVSGGVNNRTNVVQEPTLMNGLPPSAGLPLASNSSSCANPNVDLTATSLCPSSCEPNPLNTSIYNDPYTTGPGQTAYITSCDSSALNGGAGAPPDSLPLSVSTEPPVTNTNNNNAMWTAGNYYGPNAYWYPHTNYAPPYYPPPISLPMANVSPNPMMTFADHMIPNMVHRPSYRHSALPLNHKFTSPLPDYCVPAANHPLGSPYSNAYARLPGSKSHPSARGLNHPNAAYPDCPAMTGTASTQPTLQWCNPLQWQLFLNNLAVSRNPSYLVRNPTVMSYGVPLDRAGEEHRRTSVTYNPQMGSNKGFDVMELASLKLSVNPVEFDESLLFHARYFVIKSDCEYNVHQSIRHGVWCSTRAGNQCLDEAFQSVQVPHQVTYDNHCDTASVGNVMDQKVSPHHDFTNDRPGHVILFFSVRSLGYMNGVAEMIGPVNSQKRCSIWQDARFRGEIPVRWIYVKNVPNSLSKHITIESYDNRPVAVLRDTSEIRPSCKGEELLRIIHNYGLMRTAPAPQT